MAHSYRKAIYKDGYGSSHKAEMKRMANKAVRRYEGAIPDGGAYKKIFCSWEISDYEFDYAHRRQPPRDEPSAFRGDDGAWYVSK